MTCHLWYIRFIGYFVYIIFRLILFDCIVLCYYSLKLIFIVNIIWESNPIYLTFIIFFIFIIIGFILFSLILIFIYPYHLLFYCFGIIFIFIVTLFWLSFILVLITVSLFSLIIGYIVIASFILIFAREVIIKSLGLVLIISPGLRVRMDFILVLG